MINRNEGNGQQELEEKEFAELLAEASLDERRLERGQRVEAVIVQVTPEWVFIDIGGKSEGYLDRKELLDSEGRLKVKVGDVISAYYLSSSNNGRLFTTRVTGGRAVKEYLEDAKRSGIPVEGLVEREVKGGLEVKIGGGLRGFCPSSLAGLRRSDDTGLLLGQRLSFKVTEYSEDGRKIVLSRKAVLEEEQRERKEALKETLREGMTVRGTVSAIRQFGAFVDIGGVEGLLPVSEVGWDRVDDIGSRLAVGQEVEVAVLRLDWEKDRISFSLKQTLPDPWQGVDERYVEGSSHIGMVTRLTDFGAFVSLEPGVEGLVHISRLSPGTRIRHPREVLAEGQQIRVRVETLDKARRRMSLSLDRIGAPGEISEEDLRGYAEAARRPAITLGEVLGSRLAGRVKKQ